MSNPSISNLCCVRVGHTYLPYIHKRLLNTAKKKSTEKSKQYKKKMKYYTYRMPNSNSCRIYSCAGIHFVCLLMIVFSIVFLLIIFKSKIILGCANCIRRHFIHTVRRYIQRSPVVHPPISVDHNHISSNFHHFSVEHYSGCCAMNFKLVFPIFVQ